MLPSSILQHNFEIILLKIWVKRLLHYLINLLKASFAGDKPVNIQSSIRFISVSDFICTSFIVCLEDSKGLNCEWLFMSLSL